MFSRVPIVFLLLTIKTITSEELLNDGYKKITLEQTQPTEHDTRDAVMTTKVIQFHNISANATCTRFNETEDNSNSLCNYQRLPRNTYIPTYINTDPSDDVTINILSTHLFEKYPPFSLLDTQEISPKCRHQTEIYLQALENFTFWALQMYDATAKLPSGLLSGNVNQLGDFDECIAARSEIINEENDRVSGKYCLTYLQIDTPRTPYINQLHDLLNSHFPFRSTFDDPGHRVPRYSSINWALCVPSSCDHEDVEAALRTFVAPLAQNTGIAVHVRVEKGMCQTRETVNTWPTSTLIGISFFVLYTAFVLFVTIYDYIIYYGIPNRNVDSYLMAFSLHRNVNKLFTLNRSADDITAVHGIRFLNAVALLMAHKSMAVFFEPYVNRTSMSEILGKPWTVFGRAASLYTDPFIMFSGMLTAYSLFGRLNRTKKLNLFQEYISRLMRLVPTLGALILFCTLVLPWLGSGPQWNLVVTHHSNICKEYWWRNLLFIHNYYGFENMCLTHTHHVGIDTQLFMISPLFIWIVWKWPKRGISALLLIASISTFMRYYVTYTMKLSNYVHYGTSVKQLFETADNMYILPSHRLTVYIMGILLGYILRNIKTVTLKPTLITVGNLIALLSFCIAFFGPAYMGDRLYNYNPLDAAWYAAFAPIAWCISFAWIVFSAHFNYENFLTRLFSRPIFLITTRLSYAIYLTQFPIFFFNIGKIRNAGYYEFFTTTFNIKECGFVLLFSIILTLLFDTPFQNIRNIIFKKSKTTTPVKEKVVDMAEKLK